MPKKLLFFISYFLISYSFAAGEKIGIVFLHGLGGDAKMCEEWVHFSAEQGLHPTNCAAYIPEAENHSWFDMNTLWSDLAHISDPAHQNHENIAALLRKIIDNAPRFHLLKTEIQAFMTREDISTQNLHLVGYSQGGILAQLLAYSLPEPCGSLCFAGAPWVFIPDEEIQKPHSIVMGINENDELFGKIFPLSRDIFKEKVGQEWFDATVQEVIRKEGRHGLSYDTRVAVTNHFKEVLELHS